MANQHFTELLLKIHAREHAFLPTADWIRSAMAALPGQEWPAVRPMSWSAAGRIARCLLDTYVEFQAGLEAWQTRYGVKPRPLLTICPVCGDRDCPEAKTIPEMTPQEMMFLQEKFHDFVARAQAQANSPW